MLAALDLLEIQREDPPSLEELAGRMGHAPAHFQKLFTRWVGVSPKRYLQWLTLDHARTLLRERHTVLDATYGAGLSSPGRRSRRARCAAPSAACAHDPASAIAGSAWARRLPSA